MVHFKSTYYFKKILLFYLSVKEKKKHKPTKT